MINEKVKTSLQKVIKSNNDDLILFLSDLITNTNCIDTFQEYLVGKKYVVPELVKDQFVMCKTSAIVNSWIPSKEKDYLLNHKMMDNGKFVAQFLYYVGIHHKQNIKIKFYVNDPNYTGNHEIYISEEDLIL